MDTLESKKRSLIVVFWLLPFHNSFFVLVAYGPSLIVSREFNTDKLMHLQKTKFWKVFLKNENLFFIIFVIKLLPNLTIVIVMS